jgi:hypothetical protein
VWHHIHVCAMQVVSLIDAGQWTEAHDTREALRAHITNLTGLGGDEPRLSRGCLWTCQGAAYGPVKGLPMDVSRGCLWTCQGADYGRVKGLTMDVSRGCLWTWKGCAANDADHVLRHRNVLALGLHGPHKPPCPPSCSCSRPFLLPPYCRPATLPPACCLTPPQSSSRCSQ